MTPDTKTIYVQSSDIKSRAYLEYRKEGMRTGREPIEINQSLPFRKTSLNFKNLP